TRLQAVVSAVSADLNLAGAESMHALQHLTSTQAPQAPRYFLGVLAAVERGNTKVAFPLRAKSSPRGDDHIQLAQHLVEHLPTRQALRCFHPDVRRVYTTKSLQSNIGRGGAQEFCVSHVMVDERAHLLPALL